VGSICVINFGGTFKILFDQSDGHFLSGNKWPVSKVLSVAEMNGTDVCPTAVVMDNFSNIGRNEKTPSSGDAGYNERW
jgi:hypothetical protein